MVGSSGIEAGIPVEDVEEMEFHVCEIAWHENYFDLKCYKDEIFDQQS